MFVCAAHNECEVTAKGKGCPKCATIREKYYEKRAEKRRRRREPYVPREKEEE